MKLKDHLLWKQALKDDETPLKKQLDRSSALNRNLGLVFVTLLMYIGVTFVTIDDLMLLKGDAMIQLPLISIDVPLIPFFWVTPLILLGFHINVLLNLFEHSKKLYRWIFEDRKGSVIQRTEVTPFLFFSSI